MLYIATKRFLHDKLGEIEKNQVFDGEGFNLSPVMRFIEPYSAPATNPMKPAGSVLPAGQASQEKIVIKRGRGRPRKVEQ